MAKKKNKGKAPKGRAASKQKAQRGASSAISSSPFASHFVRSSDWKRAFNMDEDEDDDGNDNFLAFKGFAQNKPSSSASHILSPRGAITNANLRLRHQAITFVSASPRSQSHSRVEEADVLELEALDVLGVSKGREDVGDELIGLNGDIISETQRAIGSMKLQSGGEVVEDGSEPDSPMDITEQDDIPVRSGSTPPPPFVVDIVGDPNVPEGFQYRYRGFRKPREPSPTPSTSSGEIVLFHGRNPTVITDPAGPAQSRTDNASVSTSSALTTANDLPIISGGKMPLKAAASRPLQRQDYKPEPIWAPAPAGSWWRNQKTLAANTGDKAIKAIKANPAGTTTALSAQRELEYNDVAQAKIDILGLRLYERAQDEVSPPRTKTKRARLVNRNSEIIELKRDLKHDHVKQAERQAAEIALRNQAKAEGEDRKAYHEKVINLLRPTPPTPAASDPVETKMGFVKGSDGTNTDAEQTIAALQAEWKTVVRTKNMAKQASNGNGGDKVPLTSTKPTRRGKRGRKRDNRALRNFMSDDDDDDDEVGEDAYDDYMANLAAQVSDDGDENKKPFSFHTAPDGGPSLFVKDKEIADDEMLDEEEDVEEQSYAAMMNPSGYDSSSEGSHPIGKDLSEISDMDSSELEDDLEYTEQEQWEDEEDLRKRRHEQMTDEQIARILAKQEELGMGGDEVILEDGSYGESAEKMDGFGDVATARAAIGKYSSNPSAKKRDRGAHFPNASAFADTLDQYGTDGFDIMDFDRPSLRSTKGGRKGKMPPELEALSDEDLKANLRQSWDTDRDKKRLKKAEREELRRQGLLGSAGKKGKADFTQKYPFGITTKQVHEELRLFLQDTAQEARAFPPMDKKDRKDLHELAMALHLNSKSVGMGKNRAPVLYKSSRTPAFNTVSFLSAISRSERGLLDSDRKLGNKKGRTAARPKAFGGGTAAATIRNGEVVGAGAAQIGTESKGYKLLAKMGGWKQGMALGKEGEGRLEPVEQVMRAGRGGLGDWR